jgi:hypothetical protein
VQEIKLQTQRLAKKSEVVYLLDSDIPRDPEPAAAATLPAGESNKVVAIPWRDVDALAGEGDHMEEEEEEEEEGYVNHNM